MQFTWLKHLLVFICLFCILESTGISVLSFITKHSISQTTDQQNTDDEDATERNETKECRLKELWVGDFGLSIPPLFINVKKVAYPQRQLVSHLAWVPPVPTPPPNSIV